MQGKKLGPYLIDEEIARGGMAAVYVATHTALGNKVGLKILHARLQSDAQYRSRFVAEARVLANFRHPNILAVRDILELPDMSGIVMELLSGCALNDYYRHVRLPLPPPQVIGLFADLAAAAHHAHTKGVIHRDLKPSNVFLHCEGERVVPKLVDFGIAKLEDAALAKRLTATGSVLGTPQFMAPEQFRDPSGVTAQADVFACGVMLYEAVTARLPFDGQSVTEIMHQVITREPPRPSELVSRVPGDLEAVILRCLSKKRSDRYASAEALRAALEEVGGRVGREHIRGRNVPKTALVEEGTVPGVGEGVPALSLADTTAEKETRPGKSGRGSVDESLAESLAAELSVGPGGLDEQTTHKVSARTLPGYRILERVYHGRETVIYRGLQLDDNQRVIIKMLATETADGASIARLRHEHEILNSLDGQGVPRVVALERGPAGIGLVLQDCGGHALSQLLEGGKLGLGQSLELCIRLTEILAQLHARHVVHKDLNPSNIIVNEDLSVLELIDFGLAVRLEGRQQVEEMGGDLGGSLAYISPEQTGRMNRALDYRTDFYSLGVTFYEMLTGRRPFIAQERVELVHCHVAKRPAPPTDVVPELPTVVSDIVMKLMAKTAQERYQSAKGLLADLTECRTRLGDEDYIDAFEIATADRSERFQLSEKLYGRELELHVLMDGFHRVRQGYQELVAVTGYGGIGKTSLVNEIHKPVTQARGFFIAGKFEQYKRDVPYAALIEAFQALTRDLLARGDEELANWRQRILDALGPNGQVIIDVIPEVELIIGSQPEVVALAPAEAQNRWSVAFRSFIQVFAGEEHPLVIFLDDLQWADNASLDLMRLLFTGPESPYLFAIGAFRDNEVDAAHPLVAVLDEIERSGSPVSRIELQPLAVEHANELLADTLDMSLDKCLPVAEVLHTKSGGNPFYLAELIAAAHDREALSFDLPAGQWVWDLGAIGELGVSEDVVDLMVDKIHRLPDDAQQAIKLGACVGGQFDLHLVAVLSGRQPGEIMSTLSPAVDEGLVVLLGDAYKYLDLEGKQVTDGLLDAVLLRSVCYRFAHDKIQQAAYSLLPEEVRNTIHQQIGQRLLKDLTTDERELRIFDIVNPLNASVDLISGNTERLELAELNLRAGLRAKASAAYGPAFQYFEFGIDMLGDNRWQRQYELALRLYVEAAEAAYLIAQFDDMERLIEVVLDKAESLLDKVPAYEIRIAGLIAQVRKTEVASTALPVLRLLGVKLPAEPTMLHVGLALLRTKLALAGKGTARLLAHREMTDERALAAMRILSSIASTVYTVTPNLFPLIVLKQLQLTVRYGNSAQAPFAYALYGTLHCGVLGRFSSGYRYGEVALELLERMDVADQHARVLFTHAVSVQHFKEPLGDTLSRFRTGYRRALEVGDFEFAATNAGGYVYALFFSGASLQRVQDELGTYSAAMEQLEQPGYLNYVSLYRQTTQGLRGESEDALVVRGEFCDVDELLSRMHEIEDIHGVFQCHLNKLVLSYFMGDHEQAVLSADEAQKYTFSVVGMFPSLALLYYDSLARLAWCHVAPAECQRRLLRRVYQNQRKLKKLSKHAPGNHLHKWQLVQAELACRKGRLQRAAVLYDAAIDGAQEAGFQQEAALGNELAARCALQTGRVKMARTYLLDAHYLYRAWGGFAKVEQLEQELGEYILPTGDSLHSGGTPISSISGAGSQPGQLDPVSLLRAMRALGAQLRLDRLFEKTIRLVLEHTGAEKGLLIIELDDRFTVEAEAAADRQSIEVCQGQPIKERTDIAQSVVNFVMRTQELVYLDDASAAGKFDRDSYISQTGPRSLLCAPLLDSERLVGLVYLENNFLSGAFTAARREVLALLSEEFVQALENARAYQRLQTRTAELEKQLLRRDSQPGDDDPDPTKSPKN